MRWQRTVSADNIDQISVKIMEGDSLTSALLGMTQQHEELFVECVYFVYLSAGYHCSQQKMDVWKICERRSAVESWQDAQERNCRYSGRQQDFFQHPHHETLRGTHQTACMYLPLDEVGGMSLIAW